MTRRLAHAFFIAAFPLLACSDTAPNRLFGSMSQMYDLTFDQVNLVAQGSSVSIEYVRTAGAMPGQPAVLVVDLTGVVNVAGTSIDLTMQNMGQPRGVLQQVATTTQTFPIQRGTITFDTAPTAGAKVTGSFATTLSTPAGYTLDGDFSATVTAR
jgi:hypothetical protein